MIITPGQIPHDFIPGQLPHDPHTKATTPSASYREHYPRIATPRKLPSVLYPRGTTRAIPVRVLPLADGDLAPMRDDSRGQVLQTACARRPVLNFHRNTNNAMTHGIPAPCYRAQPFGVIAHAARVIKRLANVITYLDAATPTALQKPQPQPLTPLTPPPAALPQPSPLPTAAHRAAHARAAHARPSVERGRARAPSSSRRSHVSRR